MANPERKMWNAVLLLFLKDSQDLIDNIVSTESTIKYFKSKKPDDKETAKTFKLKIDMYERRLFKHKRRWNWLRIWVTTADFTEKCYMAGQEPDAFKEKAIEVLNGELILDKLALSKHNWNDLRKPEEESRSY